LHYTNYIQSLHLAMPLTDRLSNVFMAVAIAKYLVGERAKRATYY